MFPLHAAVRTGDVTLVKKMLHCDTNVNRTNSINLTPLHLACSSGFFDIAQLLLEQGAMMSVSGDCMV